MVRRSTSASRWLAGVGLPLTCCAAMARRPLSTAPAAMALGLAFGIVALAGCGGGDDDTTAPAQPPAASVKGFPAGKGQSVSQLTQGLPKGPVLAPTVSVVKKGPQPDRVRTVRSQSQAGHQPLGGALHRVGEGLGRARPLSRAHRVARGQAAVRRPDDLTGSRLGEGGLRRRRARPGQRAAGDHRHRQDQRAAGRLHPRADRQVGGGARGAARRR